MEVKDNRKRAASQIKRLVTPKADTVNSYSNESVRVPRKKNVRTGVL